MDTAFLLSVHSRKFAAKNICGFRLARVRFAMKTTVVCGLLGSGKTTFIRNFVANRTEKTVVLVNDFGKAGIDGEIISAGGIESVELPSGCVCCTLKFDLITTIQRIVKQFSPEHLLIEPSGVASPSGVLEALESAAIGKATVIGVVDAAEFTELYESGMYGSFFEDQIVNSDIILVNKTDLAGEPAIVAAEQLIGSINPRAVLLRTKNAVIGIPLPDISHQLPLQERAGVRGSVPAHKPAHLHFETLSFKLAQGIDLALVRKLFNDLAQGKFGRVARAKALIDTSKGPYRLDITFGRVDIGRFDKALEESRLVVIGEKLSAADIQLALRRVEQPCSL
jgi:G3E family GTPase